MEQNVTENAKSALPQSQAAAVGQVRAGVAEMSDQENKAVQF